MKMTFVRLATFAALTLTASAAFAAPSFGPGIPFPDPTKGSFTNSATAFGPGIPFPDPTKGSFTNSATAFGPGIPFPDPTKG